MSQYGNILTAVVNVIEGLAIFHGSLPATVKKRRRPVLLEVDPFPMIVVSPDKEDLLEITINNEVKVNYPVLVTIFSQSTTLTEGDIDFMLDTRETIRLALHKPSLVGIATIYDVGIDMNPAYEIGALDTAIDQSGLRAIFSNTEPRSA